MRLRPAFARHAGVSFKAKLNTFYLTKHNRNWMRTDDVQERANAEIERRTKVVSVFSFVVFVGAVCLDQKDAWPHAQNLMDARSLWKGYKSPGLSAAGGRDHRGRPDVSGGGLHGRAR